MIEDFKLKIILDYQDHKNINYFLQTFIANYKLIVKLAIYINKHQFEIFFQRRCQFSSWLYNFITKSFTFHLILWQLSLRTSPQLLFSYRMPAYFLLIKCSFIRQMMILTTIDSIFSILDFSYIHKAYLTLKLILLLTISYQVIFTNI